MRSKLLINRKAYNMDACKMFTVLADTAPWTQLVIAKLTFQEIVQ